MVTVQRKDVDVMLDATGTVTALNSVDVRPQIASTITKVHIREGQFVSAGQPLFSLDARNDEVNVTKARAQLAKDLAALADAQRQLARSKDLFAQNFISQGAVDTNQTLVDSQLAVVASDRAAIEAAQVALSYSRIVASSAGRAGAINVFPGSFVQPSGTALVTITQLDPIAVAFSLPQRNLGQALAALRGGGGKVTATFPESGASASGKLLFVDNTVDANSGTVKVKAEFANKDERLWPGAFVNIRLAVQMLKGASVIPQAAIIQSPRGKMVYVDRCGRQGVVAAGGGALCRGHRRGGERRGWRRTGGARRPAEPASRIERDRARPRRTARFAAVAAARPRRASGANGGASGPPAAAAAPAVPSA